MNIILNGEITERMALLPRKLFLMGNRRKLLDLEITESFVPLHFILLLLFYFIFCMEKRHHWHTLPQSAWRVKLRQPLLKFFRHRNARSTGIQGLHVTMPSEWLSSSEDLGEGMERVISVLTQGYFRNFIWFFWLNL